jgi:Pyruvate/2-oxoacid:ferredoxin oxidoreductase gamma subunit
MQAEVMFTGIGGQGIQLASKTLALAAVKEGRQAMLLGHYAGTMRGGQTDASVVVADGNLRSLPILPSAWSALVMHMDYWYDTRDRIRPGGVIVGNADLLSDDLQRPDCLIFPIPATSIATALEAPLSASMVLLAAYSSITGMVTLESLVAAMKELVPPYRAQHVKANEGALLAGGDVAPALAAPVWAQPKVAS